ncbi:putative RDD family membrane protein YckC [Roseimicrobium gellanilyticum]|uniref:Putative RDD family membrane protein YckC n=1 Tax=Roseimicrobium gellanilyticum TaxID=748857 RepID=A0A366HGK2_9BACT|nr:putative RDD family membrane protein YckC [Roseimicrobium gellanilyticum]
MSEDNHPTEYETASVLQRALAHGIDSALVVMVIAFAGALIGVEDAASMLLFMLVFVVALGYRIFGDSYLGGHAIGKRIVGIRVQDARYRRPCTHLQSAIRNCILFIPFMPLVELIFLCIDGQERWGDRLARTYVMRDHALKAPVHVPDRPLRLEGLEETLRHKAKPAGQPEEAV